MLYSQFSCSRKLNEICGVLNGFEYIFCYVSVTEAIPPVAETKKWLPKDIENSYEVKNTYQNAKNKISIDSKQKTTQKRLVPLIHMHFYIYKSLSLSGTFIVSILQPKKCD